MMNFSWIDRAHVLAVTHFCLALYFLLSQLNSLRLQTSIPAPFYIKLIDKTVSVIPFCTNVFNSAAFYHPLPVFSKTLAFSIDIQ